MLFAWLVPQGAWALDEITLEGKTFCVLRNSSDWDAFCEQVANAKGNSDVNAIMTADFSVSSQSCGREGAEFCGIFDGNGHTLNVSWTLESDYQSTFSWVKGVTIRNLHLTGSVKGGNYVAGLIGTTSAVNPVINIDRVWVSANVTSTGERVGGFIGHADKAALYFNDCRFDGSLTANGAETSYSGAFIGWANFGGAFNLHRCYENGTYNSIKYASFCYYWNNKYARAWGQNTTSSLCVSAHDWAVMVSEYRNVTDQTILAAKMNGEKTNSWKEVGGKAVPVGSYPMEETNFEIYTIVPGTEKGEENMLKIPFSCDKPISWIGGTYTGEDGTTQSIAGTSFAKNTYAGFIMIPGTVQHKNLKLNIMLADGLTILGFEVKTNSDAVMHNPRNLKADLLTYNTNKKLADAGVVELKWDVKDASVSDVIDTDEFLVMRSLTGSINDMETIGTVSFEKDKSSYTYRDETLVSALTAEHVDETSAVPQVRYLVVRASAQQLWGMECAASAQISCTLSGLHLLRVKDFQTAWADQTARTVKVTWQYADDGGAVWDSRAKMNIVVSSTNREGAAVDNYTIALTTDEIAACQKVIELSRSCVNYKIMVAAQQGESTIPVEAPYFLIRTAEDWTTFVAKVKAANAGYNVNASLLADITVNEIAAYEGKYAYRGTFEGNGHTLNLNISDNGSNAGLFSHAATATFRNLNLTGTLSTSQIHIGSLIGFVEKDATVTIENCRSSVKLVSSRNGDAYMGGFVGHSGTGSMQLFIDNCKFEGSFEGPNAQRNGGFVGWTPSNSGKVNITNCLFAPAAINTKFTYCDTWVWTNNPEKVTVVNSYATKEYKTANEVDGYFSINSAADWDTFRTKVEAAGGNSDVNAVLMADITITQSVGYNNPYRGTFDGNGHTLNLNLVSDGDNAPFEKANIFTIKNVHVTGTVSANVYGAGLVAKTDHSDCNFINCRVSATIKGNTVAAGFVSNTNRGKIVLNNCLFDGTLKDSEWGASLVCAYLSVDINPTNCLEHGTYDNVKKTGFLIRRDWGSPAYTLMERNNWGYQNWFGDHTVGYMSAGELASNLGAYWCVLDGNAVPYMGKAVANGSVAGKTADQIVALLGSGWTNANGNPVPKMADNKQEEIPYSAKHPFMIHSTADWDAFRQKVAEAKGQKDIYAQLMADISITEPAGVSTGYFRGTFDGCGHTLTCNIDKNWDCVAPFQNVIGNTTIRNLNVAGTIKGRIHSAGVVGNVDKSATLVIENCHVSASITTTDKYAGGFVGHAHEAPTTVCNCLFDGSLLSSSGNYAGAFIGWSAQNSKVENCLENGTFNKFNHVGANYKGFNDAFKGTNNWNYSTLEGGNPVGSMTAAQLVDSLGSQWQVNSVGQVIPKNVGGGIEGMETFYYENLGHINKKSLRVEQRRTSTLLTWENQTDEPVDYYEIWRFDKQQSKWEVIISQLIEMQYEDKQTSPVHQYIYKVRGVTSCEGLTYDETDEVEGMCEQTGTVEGNLCFLDGAGIPGMNIVTTLPDGKEKSATTDESGFFRLTDLPYVDGKETNYALTTEGIDGIDPLNITLGTEPGDNVVTGQRIEVEQSVKLSGYVTYDGTSIPVQGVSFKVDGHDVRTASGLVTSDHEGKFAFRILPGSHQSIQAVKNGHKFWRDGFYHQNDDDPDTLKAYSFTTDKAGLMFYDQTRVKMIGRIVGGKTQGELPLGSALSKNNLGDSLRMVLTLEGDNASRLVFDNQDRTLKERDEVFKHENACQIDKKYDYQTRVHTTLNRMVVYPDKYTGEYEVLLPPVKWKIQQITASGYATLFQDGQVGDVIDLTDSITPHETTVKGKWRTIGNGADVENPVERYHAKYSRIYHTPVRIEYKQQGFGDLEFFGDRYYAYKNVKGDKQQLTLAYKAADGTTTYTFGHPVFSIAKKYPFWLSATEKYYYNNNTKSDTVDVVHLDGGVVTIHNGLEDPLHRDTVHLDSLGQGTYVMEITQKPYLLTGDDALQTMTMTLLMDGTYYEAEPLKGYVFHIQQATGAQDILSYEKPILVDVLRDPPGGSSHATLSKGSTLRYAYSMDLAAEAGIEIGGKVGFGLNSTFGIVAAPLGVGGQTSQGLKVEGGIKTAYDMTYSINGERAFEYTMTAAEDISTSSDPKLVGADGDLYIGTIQNIVVKPALAIRAIPDSVWKVMDGALKAESTIEIARGQDDKGKTLHLVRDEVLTYGPDFKSNFVHSQYYIVNQLIPELTQQVYTLMYTGTKDEAKTQANATGEPVYLSLVDKNNPDFGTRYTVIYPDGKGSGDFVDKVERHNACILEWMKMIAQNEEEKLTASDRVANYDVDGGTTVNYSETFHTEYSTMRSVYNPFTSITDKFFEEDDANFFTALGSLATKLLGFEQGVKLSLKVDGMGGKMEFSITPHASVVVTPKSNTTESYSRTESFTISMDKKSHLSVDVFRVENVTTSATSNDKLDVFIANNFWSQIDTNEDFLKREFDTDNMRQPRSFVYRTVGGATCRPWEDERKSHFYQAGTVIDARTKRIENPQIKIDRQSISGVPYGEPARFKLYLTNESEQPEAAYIYFDLYQADMSNPDGARLMIDGMPLTGTSRTIEVRPGVVTEKTLEVYASEKFDYEGLRIGLISQADVDCYSEVAFDVHFLQTAGPIAISSPGDKWIMNCDAPTDGSKGWYLPVVISGFDKNQHNFDHIEFQYKETTRGDDYWTNLCGYYADSTLYKAASGTKEMIPENGNIIARFFGEGTVMEKGYDLKAVLFCRNGNAFLTSESKVLTGVKDTRRPQLFGTPEPKSGVLGPGDNIIFNFSEDIEYNYLQATTNFEVVGETNETDVQEAPSLQFGGEGYAQTQSRRNFNGKNLTIEVMIKPEATGTDMPIFSHGSDGKQLQLWLTAEKKLKAIVGDKELTSDSVLNFTGFQRVALVLDNDNQRLMLYDKRQIGRKDSVTYSGTGPLTFGAADDAAGNTKYFKGRMLQGRLWYRAMDLAGLNRYGGKLLTGYELGLVDYYPMNDGRGTYASDLAQGAHLTLEGASWAQPEGMSLKIDNDTTGTSTTSNIFEIKTDEDWNTFRSMVEAAKGQYDVNAQLMADINITQPVGVGSARFRGDFNGNGHTLTCNIGSHGNCTAPFQYVTTSTIRNVNVSGSITGSWHSSGLVGHVERGSNVVVTNCRVSPKITVYVRGGGIVGYADAGTLTVRNCRFDGAIYHTGHDLETDNSAASFAGAFVGCATSNTTLAVANCLDYGGYFDFWGRYSSCYINKTRWGGTNNWTRNPKVAQVINSVGNMSAEEIKNALGSGWMVDASGDVVPRVNNNQVYMASNPKGLQLRSDLFQRDAEQDYTLMFWFKTAKMNGTLLANGSGQDYDEGALHKFFIGFEDRTLKYRTNGREFTLGDNLCDDGWHHFAMTVNRSRNVASIYVDNEARAQLTTDSLGGMLGTRFMLGDMLWQEEGDPLVYEANAFTGHIDGLMLFEQALPTTLIKRYSEKSPGGEERGLLLHMPFDHQVRQKSGELTLQPLALSTRVKRDNDGIDTGKRDSVFVNSVDDILAHIDRIMGAPVAAYEKLRNLKFSYVGRDNLVLVNIDEQDARVNKQNVYVTLYDIPDKNGNFMKSPATECFYVNCNPLTWFSLGKHRNVTVKEGHSLTIAGVIMNNGGKTHTYTIENLPRWITANKTSDIIQPQGEDEVTFTISPDLEVGSYDQIIYLTDEDGMSDALYLELTVEGEEPEWKVDPALMRYSMNVVAQVFINNTLITDSHDKVAAFDVNGRCMGVNNIEFDPTTGQSMLYMTVYDSTTVDTRLYFRLWHYATGKTMQLETSKIIRFGNKSIVGTVDDPITMRAEDTFHQTIDLAEGWNWISFNVFNADFGRLSSVLNRFPWQEGDILAEDSEGLTLVYKKGRWISTTGTNIMDLELSQKKSYSILVQKSHQIDIWGHAFQDEEERTIEVKPGWSSIGYTPLVNLPVTTALTEYFDEATPGDVVKNQHAFAMFTADGKGGGKWQGTLKYMKPGEGYMMHRQKQTTTTFTYPYYEPGENFFETTVAYAPQTEGSRFAKTMSMVAEAEGVELQEGDRLVAYANGEVVGSVECREQRVESATATEKPLFYLSIEGEQEVPLTFAIERGNEIIATTGEVMKYQVNGISGTVDEPTKISFVKTDMLPQTGWYTVSGIKLPKAPTQSGVYIYNGNKKVIK